MISGYAMPQITVKISRPRSAARSWRTLEGRRDMSINRRILG